MGTEGLWGRLSCPGPGGKATWGAKRAAPLGGATGTNYRRTGGFGSLPDPDVDYSTWTIEALRKLVSECNDAVYVLYKYITILHDDLHAGRLRGVLLGCAHVAYLDGHNHCSFVRPSSVYDERAPKTHCWG